MSTILHKTRSLGVFPLVMIAIVSVDSLRNLPIGAQYGLALVSFYFVAGALFFLPLAWVASQLAVKFPNVGGSYLWIETAFGKTFGYLSIWLQWTYNVIWYPTIFAFISSTILSLASPNLETNKWFILMISASLFWMITFVHSYGIRTSSWMSTVSAILGTIIPMCLMIAFAAYWLISGNPSATPLTLQGLLPSAETYKDLGYFSNILFSLLGIEVIAMHAGNVLRPEKSYPRALLIAAITILLTLVLSSLALCILIPSSKIMLLTGIMDVFKLFFTTYHFPFGVVLIGWCIVLGGVGIASSWMIGLARGLHVALLSTNAPKSLQKLNKNGVPLNVLYLQGIIYTLLLSAFLLLPNVNNAYWLLSALSAQFSLLYYVLLFAAAIKLLRGMHKSKFQIFLGIVLPVSAGVLSIIGIIVGFLPPSNISADHVFQYEFFMIMSLVLFCLIPFFILKRKQGKKFFT